MTPYKILKPAPTAILPTPEAPDTITSRLEQMIRDMDAEKNKPSIMVPLTVAERQEAGMPLRKHEYEHMVDLATEEWKAKPEPYQDVVIESERDIHQLVNTLGKDAWEYALPSGPAVKTTICVHTGLPFEELRLMGLFTLVEKYEETIPTT